MLRKSSLVTIIALIIAGPALSSPKEAWVGAPFSGTWPSSSGCDGAEYPSNTCSLPRHHWTAFGGQWSVDLPKQANTTVKLYVAPQVESDEVSTVVERVSESCKNGREGGKTVRIGVYIEGQKVGTIAYAHVIPTVNEGETVDRWGTEIGRLFSTSNSDPLCWTGAHLHFEIGNTSGISCYNAGYGAGQNFSETNFIGFVGGSRVSSPRTPCP